MKFIVKPGCSFFVDGVKQKEGDTVEIAGGKALKRYMHLVEPVEEDEDETEEKAEKPARRRRSTAEEKTEE